MERGDGARTSVLWVSVHARKRHNGTLAICIHYTRASASARLLSTSSREESPWGLRSRSLFCLAFSPSLVLSCDLLPSRSTTVSAYVQAYTLSSVFLTEADSGMHDGPKVSLNTPPRHLVNRLRHAFIRAARWRSPRRNRSKPSGFRCHVVYLYYMERNAAVPRRKNLAPEPERT